MMKKSTSTIFLFLSKSVAEVTAVTTLTTTINRFPTQPVSLFLGSSKNSKTHYSDKKQSRDSSADPKTSNFDSTSEYYKDTSTDTSRSSNHVKYHSKRKNADQEEENIPESNWGIWSLNPEALTFLKTLPAPIYAISAIGPARVGKSFWLGKLAERNGYKGQVNIICMY